MKKWLLLLAIIVVSGQAFAQQKVKDTILAPFFSHFQLRQSFQSPDAQQSPAQLQLTLPQQGAANWLVDAAASLTIRPMSCGPFTSKFVGEFHRNTLADSAQFNYQAGFNFSWYRDRGDNVLTPVWTGNLKYIHNITDTSNNLAATLNFTFYRSGKHILDLGRPGYLNNEHFTYQLTPSAEIQYQQVFPNDEQMQGGILRPLVDLSASIALNHKKTKGKLAAPSKMIELAVDYVNRYAVVNSTGNKEGYTKLFRPAVNYYFLNTNSSSVSLGASYNLGSDPLNGLKAQQFWLFALQVQL